MYTASTSWKVHFSTVMNRGSSASRLRRRRRKNHVGNMRFQQRWPSAIRRLQAPLTVARDVQRDRGGSEDARKGRHGALCSGRARGASHFVACAIQPYVTPLKASESPRCVRPRWLSVSAWRVQFAPRSRAQCRLVTVGCFLAKFLNSTTSRTPPQNIYAFPYLK